MKRGRLSEAAKDFAVLCFARFMRPTQVCDAIEERFGVRIERNAAQMFDPTTQKGQVLGKKRKQLFAEVRERFLKELEDIPIANRAVRLQQLQHHYNKAVDAKVPNVRLALDVLEKAAKEAGNFHSNETRVHHTGSVKVEEVTEDEMRNGLAAVIAATLEDMKAGIDPGNVTKH